VDVDTVTARYRWNPEDNDLIDLKADLFYTQNTSNVNQIFIQHSGPPFNITGVEHIIYLNKVTQWGANVNNTSEFDIAGRPLTLSYGASYKHEVIGQPDIPNSYLPAIEPPTFPPVPASTLVNARIDSEFRDGWRKEASAFVAAEYQPTDHLTLNAALRYTHLETQDNNPISGTEPDNRTVSGTAPVFSALYEIQPGLQVYGKYAEALRMPSLFESTNGWSAVPSLSAAPLRPEHAKSKEIGINYQTEDLFGTGGLLRTKLAYFDNDIKDYITRETSGAYNFVNIQRARLRGWELALDYEQGNFFGKFAYSKYVETEYCDVDGTCTSGGTQGGYAHLHVPPEQSASLTLGGRFMEEKLVMGARVNYIGERASVDFSGVSGGTNRAVNWDPYTTVDLFGSYKFNDQVTLDWAVDNLTDQYYMDSLTIGLMPSPGRTVRVGLTANF
jgi:hemoglobin/transferrin/lactoferrin receptor protein